MARLPWTWARIVKAVAGPVEASPLLTPTEKLVYCEFVGLSVTQSGCTLGAGGLAQRLGLSPRTVERIRKELMVIGLLERKERGAGRAAAWFPTMPESCRPNTRRLDEDGLREFAQRLAYHIIRKRAQTTSANDGGVIQQPVKLVS